MSRFVAVLLLVSVVSAQFRLKGTGNEPSIVIDSISGGNFPDGAFSIGHGTNSNSGDGGHGADYGTNGIPGYNYDTNSVRPGQDYATSRPTAGYGTNGGNAQFNPNYGAGQGQNYHADNGIGDGGLNNYYGQRPANGANVYGVSSNNPGQRPANAYDNYYNQNNANTHTPVRNSATRYPGFWKYLFTWW